MKKSQILAAIALAMALGVVAPVVSVENASAYTAAAEKAAKDDIKKAQDSFPDVTLHSGKVVDGFNEYQTVDGLITNAQGVVTNAKAKTGSKSAATSLRTAVNGIVGDLADNKVLSDATKEALESDTWKRNGYDDVAKIVASVVADYNKAAQSSISAEKTAANKALEGINDAIKAAQEILDQDVATDESGDIANLIAKYEELTGNEETAPTTVAELNALIAKVEAALPQMKRYRAVATAIANLNVALEDNTKTDDEINKLIGILNAAVAGTGNGTSNPADKDDAKAPATGIVGTAEGTATTVSIVAGLATALTALGAGVVAYRSARRK